MEVTDRSAGPEPAVDATAVTLPPPSRPRAPEVMGASDDRTIDVPKFKDIAGVSRKFAIPLLEYFDREKVTLRVGDKRVIR